MKKVCLATIAVGALTINSLSAANLSISIGIRETGGSGPAFANAGSSGGIEFVNLDGLSLNVDGTWQLFTFTPSTDTLTAFAGATANSILDTDWVSLDAIRIRNSDGITGPIRLWIDDIANTDSSGTTNYGFEPASVGTEVIFQEPSFSGSTSANLLPGSSSLVSAAEAFSGVQSDEINFQFVDGTPTRWVRLTTFGTPNLPNIALHAKEIGFSPTISFYAKAIIVPEPSTLALGVVGIGLLAWLKRRQTN